MSRDYKVFSFLGVLKTVLYTVPFFFSQPKYCSHTTELRHSESGYNEVLDITNFVMYRTAIKMVL